MAGSRGGFRSSPATVLMPVTKLAELDGNQFLQILGSQEVPAGSLNGKYLTGRGYVTDPMPSERINGTSGWTPVFTPEQDGTRSLLKVADWMGGSGTKPTIGMYLAASGYITAKAQAFNFNISKRIENHNVKTTLPGNNFALTFGSPFPTPPRVIPAAIGSVSGRPNQAVALNITTTGCTIETYRAKASLLTLGGALLDAVSGIDVDVLVIEA